MSDIPLLHVILANWLGIAMLISLFLLFRTVASPAFSHWLGESLVVRFTLRRLDPTVYRVYHDVHLPGHKREGGTRLDHVVVSPFGIFVIQTFKLRGWIFGSSQQCLWTQRFGKNDRRFDNPLPHHHQQVRSLTGFLGLPEDLVRPVLLFVGPTEFKTRLPDNVLNRDLIPWIRQHDVPLLDSRDLYRATSRLNTLTRATHLQPVIQPAPAPLKVHVTG